MSVQGKIYKKYLFQAKYVIKGKKLKTSTAVVKRKQRMCSNVSIEHRATSAIDNIDFELEENIQMPKSRFNMYNKAVSKKAYSETVKEVVVGMPEAKKAELSAVAVSMPEVKKAELSAVTVSMPEVKKAELSSVVVNVPDVKEVEVHSAVISMPEVKKVELDSVVVEMPEDKTMSLNRIERKGTVIEVIEARNISVAPVYDEVQNKGKTLIERGKLEEIKNDMQSEMERIRLLELAREKKEKLDQERIEKAREKKEEKLLKEKKLEEQALKEKEKQLQRIEKEKQFKEAKRKQRKNESKSFIIVAALLAVIIVAGIANIGKTMYSEIQKDNVLVGDASEENNDNKKSLFEGLSLFDSKDTLKEDSTNTTEEATSEEQEPSNEDLENLDNVEEIIVADSSTKPPTTANHNVGTSNKIDIKDYLDNKNTSTSKPKDNGGVPPTIEDSGEIETGSSDEAKKEYVEVSYSGSNFELYKTANSNITKSTVKAGQCIKYTRHKVENGVINIPIADADGIWFIVEGDVIKEKFAYDGEDMAGIAVVVLMREEDGKEIEDDIIYAKQGSDVKISGTYYTKDDEGEKMNEYTAIVKNVVGKMVLYKQIVKENE